MDDKMNGVSFITFSNNYFLVVFLPIDTVVFLLLFLMDEKFCSGGISGATYFTE